jgi:predicted TIM-barrel fold metal-dependent hydrolase
MKRSVSTTMPDRLPHRDDESWFHFRVDQRWLDRRREPVIDPELPIVDPHHHLWDHPDHRYLVPEFLSDLRSGHNIRATVFVEAASMYRVDGPPELRPAGETEFVNGVAAMFASGLYGPVRACAGIVGFADLERGAGITDLLEAHIAAGGGRFRGIRNPAVWHADKRLRSPRTDPPKGLMLDRRFRAGFARLAPLKLSFEAWLYHTQIGELADLARAFPQTTIILNHVGAAVGIGPFAGRHAEVFADWSAGIRQLAMCPNVFVKVGGLGMKIFGLGFHGARTAPSSAELARAWKPYIESCIKAFGVERCMFESNFPVDKEICSYRVIWNAFKRVASGYSAAEKTALFSRTAATVYRLDIPGAAKGRSRARG